MPSDSRTSRTPGRLAVERVIYSQANYWFAFVGDAVATLVLLVVGIRLSAPSLLRVMASIVVGFLAWGGVEYGVHRWILHGRPSMATRAHARHHADGKALIGAPALMSAALAGATWAALSVVLTAGQAALTVSGLYLGYNYYALLHHLQHHHRGLLARMPSLVRLEHAHRTHHARCVVNYGVSTTWWDRAFGSYQPSSSLDGYRRPQRIAAYPPATATTTRQATSRWRRRPATSPRQSSPSPYPIVRKQHTHNTAPRYANSMDVPTGSLDAPATTAVTWRTPGMK